MISLELLSLGDVPASEGFGAVAVAAVGAFLALALMYVVLELINAVYRKNHSNDEENDTGNTEEGKTESSPDDKEEEEAE